MVWLLGKGLDKLQQTQTHRVQVLERHHGQHIMESQSRAGKEKRRLKLRIEVVLGLRNSRLVAKGDPRTPGIMVRISGGVAQVRLRLELWRT